MGMSGFILRSVRNMEDAFFFSLSLFLSFKFVNNSAECLSFLNARVNFKLEKKRGFQPLPALVPRLLRFVRIQVSVAFVLSYVTTSQTTDASLSDFDMAL